MTSTTLFCLILVKAANHKLWVEVLIISVFWASILRMIDPEHCIEGSFLYYIDIRLKIFCVFILLRFSASLTGLLPVNKCKFTDLNHFYLGGGEFFEDLDFRNVVVVLVRVSIPMFNFSKTGASIRQRDSTDYMLLFQIFILFRE